MLGKSAVHVQFTVMYHMSRAAVCITARTKTMEVCDFWSHGKPAFHLDVI